MLGAVILYWGDLWIEGGDLFLGEVNYDEGKRKSHDANTNSGLGNKKS